MVVYVKYVNGEKAGEIESCLSAEENKTIHEIREPGKEFYFERVKIKSKEFINGDRKKVSKKVP